MDKLETYYLKYAKARLCYEIVKNFQIGTFLIGKIENLLVRNFK